MLEQLSKQLYDIFFNTVLMVGVVAGGAAIWGVLDSAYTDYSLKVRHNINDMLIYHLYDEARDVLDKFKVIGAASRIEKNRYIEKLDSAEREFGK